jgi:hypothetical protein
LVEPGPSLDTAALYLLVLLNPLQQDIIRKIIRNPLPVSCRNPTTEIYVHISCCLGQQLLQRVF